MIAKFVEIAIRWQCRSTNIIVSKRQIVLLLPFPNSNIGFGISEVVNHEQIACPTIKGYAISIAAADGNET